MPLYEYECLECGLHFDRLERFGEPKPTVCSSEHRRVRRLLSQLAIVFKGLEFYVTANRRGSVQKHANGDQQRKEKESTSE